MDFHDVVGALRRMARLLVHRPGFALAAILILALGIGANTAIFSLVSAVLLRPLPYPDPDRLVVARELKVEQGEETARVSPATFEDWRTGQRSFSGLVAISEGSRELGGGPEPRQVRIAAVSAGYFETLGVPPALGRGFRPEHDAPGAEPTAVIGDALWRGWFGGDSALVGRSIRLGERSYRVIGVAAEGFEYPAGVEIWMPIHLDLPDFGSPRGARFLLVLGRLRPGSELEVAESDLSGISGAIDDPQMEGWRARLVPLHDHIVGDVGPALLILLAAVVFVLLIACANVANLLLARTTRRREELAIRAALGAGRARITGELLSETLFLSLAGGLLGLLLASWSLDLLIAISPRELPRVDEIAVNAPVLAFTLIVSLATGLVAGVVPSLRFSRPDLTAPLRQGGGVRSTGGVGASRLRGGLVVAEVALSLVLLSGAGLMGKSFLAILRVESGFDARRVHTFHLTLPGYRYADQRAGLVFADRLLERVRAVPGVGYAGLTRNLPLSGRSMTAPVRVEGVEPEALSVRPQAQVSSVTPDYFRAMGIALREGRPFSGADDGEAPPVAIVSETFARTYFPGEDPIGKQARTLFGSQEMKTIVGVVADVHHLSPTREVAPKFYQPLAQFPSSSFDLVVRADMDIPGLVPAVRTAVASLDPQLPITGISTLDALLSRSVAQPRFYAQMLGVFAALALVLALVGFYAVMAGGVMERRREIGVRMAVGARMNQVVALVVREGALLTGIGLVLGFGATVLLTRLLEGLLFRVSPLDPLVLVAVTAFLAGLAALATVLPARAAARIDPMLTLRE